MGYPTALDVFIIICFVTVFAALGIIHILRQQKDWVGWLKFIYSEKATQFSEISTLLLSYVVPVKSKLKISQNFVAFSEYMNFNQPQNDPCIQFGLVQAHLGLSYFTSNNLIFMHLHFLNIHTKKFCLSMD